MDIRRRDGECQPLPASVIGTVAKEDRRRGRLPFQRCLVESPGVDRQVAGGLLGAPVVLSLVDLNDLVARKGTRRGSKYLDVELAFAMLVIPGVLGIDLRAPQPGVVEHNTSGQLARLGERRK